MKALPRRKGNHRPDMVVLTESGLNESPSQKEGKSEILSTVTKSLPRLNESPSQKEGKWHVQDTLKNTPKSLNESPSQKEGKSESLTFSRTRLLRPQ